MLVVNIKIKKATKTSEKTRTMVGYETQGPSSRAESRARIFEFPIFSKLRSGLCFYFFLSILSRSNFDHHLRCGGWLNFELS